MSAVNPLNPLSEVLNELNLQFAVVGSFASSARGVPRATMGVDMVVRIAPPQSEKLAAALGKAWYADAPQMRDAIAAGRSFNLIHLGTGWKIDMFPAHTEFHESELRRATIEPVTVDGEIVMCPVSTTEDVLLAKLRWYRDGGEVSDKQWSDITGLLAHNADLDFEYVNPWAQRLEVADLLERAVQESAAE